MATDSTAGPLGHILERVRALSHARRRGGKAAAAASLIALLYVSVLLRQGRRPKVTCRRTAHNLKILQALAEVIDKPYYPSWLTPNAHVNCALGFFKRGPRISKTRELVRTWDGGSFALDWRNRGAHQRDLAANTPTLLVIHGLNGHSEEACVLYAMETAHARGWRSVAMNHRGCGGTVLTSGWSYCAGFTGDVRMAVSHIHRRYPEAPVFAVGFSLGANLLVKYLGEEGRHGGRPLAGAVAVSNPWNFEHNHLGGEGRAKSIVESVMAKFYSLALTVGLKIALKEHMDNDFLQRRRELDLKGCIRAGTLAEYDACMIVPMWGYRDVQRYLGNILQVVNGPDLRNRGSWRAHWRHFKKKELGMPVRFLVSGKHYQHEASSNHYIADVRCPLLCINADDDPICQPHLFPLDVARTNPCVVFVTTRAGGHIGFGEGFNPFGRQSWADRLMSRYFEALLAARHNTESATTADVAGEQGERSDDLVARMKQPPTIGKARL